jgi:NADPH:quinone reductase-like Zn-dependent oxidoreductase
MKAAVTTKYGVPDVLEIQEVPKPHIQSNEVLIKVMASSLNSGDVRIRALDGGGVPPFVMRLIFGWKKPKSGIQGLMFAGIVEAVGNGLTQWKVGDQVFGDTGMQMGAHAEFLAIKANKMLYPMPKNASFEEAAAILFGGNTALYFLQKAGIQNMEKPNVLIYGATGSVGVAAIEVAKHYGATVTAVCSETGEDLARSLGADVIVNYKTEDFRKLHTQFDLIFDAVGKINKKDIKGILKPGGGYRNVASMDVAKNSIEMLKQLKSLFEAGELHACIDKTYPLEEIRAAHAYVDTGRKKGNVVISLVS